MAEKGETAQKTIWDRIQNIPHQILYLALVIMIAIPVFIPIGIPISINKNSRDFYNTIEALPIGSGVLFDMAFGAAMYTEQGYSAEAVMTHLLSKGLKVVIVSSAPGIQVYISLLDKVAKRYQYGTDYVNLGYIPGREIMVASLATDLWATAGTDVYGTSLSQFPIMARFHRVTDFSLLILADSDTDMPFAWLRQWFAPYNIYVLAIYYGALGSLMLPYYPAQVKGYLLSIRGGAEYELLINRPGAAIQGLDQNNLSGLYTIAVIVLGNIGFFMGKVKRRK